MISNHLLHRNFIRFALSFLIFSLRESSEVSGVSILVGKQGEVTLSNEELTIEIYRDGLVNRISYGPLANVLLEKPANFTGPDLGPFGGKPGDRAYYDSQGGNNLTGYGYYRFTSNSGPQVLIINQIFL